MEIKLFFIIFFTVLKLNSQNFKFELDGYLLKKDSLNAYVVSPVVKLTFLENTTLLLSTAKKIRVINNMYLKKSYFDYYFAFGNEYYFKDTDFSYSTQFLAGKFTCTDCKKTKFKKGISISLILNEIKLENIKYDMERASSEYFFNDKEKQLTVNDIKKNNIFIFYKNFFEPESRFKFKIDSNIINMIIPD